MVHAVHVVAKFAALVHVVQPVILLLHAEHAVLLDLYCPDAQATHLPLLTIYIPPHAVQVADVVEQDEQLL